MFALEIDLGGVPSLLWYLDFVFHLLWSWDIVGRQGGGHGPFVFGVNNEYTAQEERPNLPVSNLDTQHACLGPTRLVGVQKGKVAANLAAPLHQGRHFSPLTRTCIQPVLLHAESFSQGAGRQALGVHGDSGGDCSYRGRRFKLGVLVRGHGHLPGGGPHVRWGHAAVPKGEEAVCQQR